MRAVVDYPEGGVDLFAQGEAAGVVVGFAVVEVVHHAGLADAVLDAEAVHLGPAEEAFGCEGVVEGRQAEGRDLGVGVGEFELF